MVKLGLKFRNKGKCSQTPSRNLLLQPGLTKSPALGEGTCTCKGALALVITHCGSVFIRVSCRGFLPRQDLGTAESNGLISVSFGFSHKLSIC